MNQKRIYAIGGTCITAYVASLIFESFYWRIDWAGLRFELFCFWVFPGGVIKAIFGWNALNLSWWGLIAGWAVHLLLAFGILRVKNPTGYYVLYALFCLVLLLDIIGTHEDWVQFSYS